MPVTRFCPICRQADDAPRHVIYGDDPDVARHMDCCRDAGCPDGSCPIVTAGAEDLRDDELRAYIAENAEQIAVALDERDEDTRHFTTDAATANPIVLQGVTQ